MVECGSQCQAARLVALSGAERLALDAIRRRASMALALTNAPTLAVALATTRTYAWRLLSRLDQKGWIVSDGRGHSWLPTSMAGLAHRMAEVEAVVRALAAVDACRLPADMRPLVADARDLLADCGPRNGHVAHPVAAAWISAQAMRLPDIWALHTAGDSRTARQYRAYLANRRRRRLRARAAHRAAMGTLAAEEGWRKQAEP